MRLIQFVYQDKLDDFFILAGHVIDGRARMANLRTGIKTKEITGKMPEKLRESVLVLSKKYRNKIRHCNTKETSLDFNIAVEYLMATVLGFYYYRFFEDHFVIASQNKSE